MSLVDGVKQLKSPNCLENRETHSAKLVVLPWPLVLLLAHSG